MSLAQNTPNNQRLVNDGNFVSTVAIGVVSAGFNLVQAAPYPATEQVVLKIVTGVLAGSNTTGAFTVQDSADGVTYTSLATLGTWSVNVPTTLASTSQNWLLPPATRQYVRVSSSAAGTTGNYTTQLVF